MPTGNSKSEQDAEGSGIAQAHGEGASASVIQNIFKNPTQRGCYVEFGRASFAILFSVLLVITTYFVIQEIDSSNNYKATQTAIAMVAISPTASSTPIAAASLTPTRSSTRISSTNTPILTSTPLPQTSTPPKRTATPKLTPIPAACNQSVTGQFKNLWNKYRKELGCPHQASESGADTVYFVEQWFENGHMFFFSSAPVHFVIVKYGTIEGGQPGTGTWQSFSSEPWSGKDENFCNEGNGLDPPIYDNFNKVWCFEPEVRDKIGYPRDIDSRLRARLYGTDNSRYVLAQGFDNGFILRDSDGAGSGLAYVFLNNGNYIRDYYK